MSFRTISQLVYEELIEYHRNPGAIIEPNYLNTLSTIRTLLIQNSDPTIHMNIGNLRLLMNLSHQLPLLRALFPAYDTVLPRIAKMVFDQEQYLKVIDIGANIGDTVSSIAQQVTGSFLCIEGVQHYFNILLENVKSLNANVICTNAICGECDGEEQGYIKTEQGTGHFVAETDRRPVQITSLQTMLEQNPYFKDANLLKIDTDGSDTQILRGAKDFLAATGPTIFFEYVPVLILQKEEHPLAIFSYLASLGYRYGLFYSNLGIPLEIVDITNQSKLEEMIQRIDNIKIGYYDVFLPRRDLNLELFIDFFQNELEIVGKLSTP